MASSPNEFYHRAGKMPDLGYICPIDYTGDSYHRTRSQRAVSVSSDGAYIRDDPGHHHRQADGRRGN
ncbi:hypothetical protein SPHINGOT1_80266 [Sphingomonas sp. T1]|nr:hypothetical protein SPHINGOT1_80266 [Sphingomonas sp. T1]